MASRGPLQPHSHDACFLRAGAPLAPSRGLPTMDSAHHAWTHHGVLNCTAPRQQMGGRPHNKHTINSGLSGPGEGDGAEEDREGVDCSRILRRGCHPNPEQYWPRPSCFNTIQRGLVDVQL